MRIKLPLIIKAFYSPFKPPKLKFYFGKTAIHTPYFLPRRWRKYTHEEIVEVVNEKMSNPKFANITFEQWYNNYKNYTKAVDKRIGFDFIDVGWKTKWSSDDYRFEYNGVWSLVCFGYQFAVQFIPEHDLHYWESFLVWHFETDKNLNWQERIDDCRKRYPNSWTSHSGDEKVTTDYWTVILKNKYLTK